jgi:prophage antirepressor-like protein
MTTPKMFSPRSDMSNLSVFRFDGNSVQIVLVDGEPWFVAKDLCLILDIKNVSDALGRLDGDEKNTIVLTDGNRGNPNTAIVSESGMYALVLGSRKPDAKSFRKWVTAEVIPQIRKTGSYGARPGFEWFERVKLYRRHTKIPTGWFSIFEEMCGSLMADFEDAGYSLPMGSIPDISVGKCFCNYLRSLGHGLTPGNGLIQEYQHHYPDGRVVTANIYNDTLLPDYRRWFKEIYRKEKLPAYLKSKDPLALPSLCRLLQLPEGSH